MYDLLGCPFCGGQAEIERAGTPRVSTVYACTECGCRLETGEEHNHGSQWNRRTAAEQVRAPAVEQCSHPVWGQDLDGTRVCGKCGQTIHPDDMAVDRFAAAMKTKLAQKRAEGRGGWDDKEQCTAEFLSELLREHVEKGDPLDVGNLAMMLHQRGDRIRSALTGASAVGGAERATADAWQYRVKIDGAWSRWMLSEHYRAPCKAEEQRPLYLHPAAPVQPGDGWQPIDIDYLRETLAWVRRNFAGGSTKQVREQIDLALEHLIPAAPTKGGA